MRDLQCHRLSPVRLRSSFTISMARGPESVRTTVRGTSSQTSKNDSLTVSDPSISTQMACSIWRDAAITP